MKEIRLLPEYLDLLLNQIGFHPKLFELITRPSLCRTYRALRRSLGMRQDIADLANEEMLAQELPGQ